MYNGIFDVNKEVFSS